MVLTLDQLRERFRREVSDTDAPYLWSDDDVLDYIIDAQDVFVRLTGGIADTSTAAICQIATVIGQAFNAHSPYILRIRSARHADGRDISLISEGDLGRIGFLDYGVWNPQKLDSTQGPVSLGVLGLEDSKIRWINVPAEIETIHMHVMRLPYPRITDWDGTGNALVIGEQHHRHLLRWMKHLAYGREDSETYDKQLAEDNEAAFRAYCAEARAEAERARFKPRVVRYRGA